MTKRILVMGVMLLSLAASGAVLATTPYERGHMILNEAWDLEAQAIRMGYSAKSRLRLQEQAADEYRKALEQFVLATRENDRDYKAYSMSGLVLRRLGRFDEAMDAYKKALAINPDDNQTTEYLGEAFVDTSRLDEAKKTYFVLMKRNTPLAADLLAYMKMWAGKHVASGPALSTEQMSGFTMWLSERMQVTEMQLGLSPAKANAWR